MRSIALGSIVIMTLFVGRAGGAEPVESDSGGFDHAVPTVEGAFEIAMNAGYAAGTGEIGDGMHRVQDLSGVGGGGELKLGYRPVGALAFGVFGGCWPLGDADASAMSGTSTTATAGIFADWHLRAGRSVDPWVGLSSGWRGLWLIPDEGEATSVQGLELARLQIGVDYRITPDIAIAPVLGASLAIFLTRDAPGMADFENIEGPRPNYFFFGGVQVRFDVSGRREAAR